MWPGMACAIPPPDLKPDSKHRLALFGGIVYVSAIPTPALHPPPLLTLKRHDDLDDVGTPSSEMSPYGCTDLPLARELQGQNL
jgi:hypothetical protein